MASDPISLPAAPPPSFSHHHHSHNDHHGILSLNSIGLIAIPIILIAVLVIVITLLLLLKFQIAKSKKKNRSSTGSFRMNVIDGRQISKCTGSFNANSIIYSPDIRNCIYAGKLVCASQNRNKGVQVFTYRELEVATDGFSERNLIGNGGFRVLYRGILSDGTIAAIKMLHRDGKQGEREFRTEVDLLSRLHSRYLVGLLGYCADQHHRILAFEFMPNGSLQQHLHHTHSRQRQPLDWRTRLRIALDCARGLEFLHEYTDPAVIHRDFKCSNILLDHNYRAKVSDFGMAKRSSDKINGQISTRVFGTTGYVAPEYASTGKLTTKSDVYSYGVVLLELLTGRVPVDITRPPGEHVLVSWVSNQICSFDGSSKVNQQREGGGDGRSSSTRSIFKERTNSDCCNCCCMHTIRSRLPASHYRCGAIFDPLS